MEVDVFILGAGPAGCCVALNLARSCHVLIIDRNATPQPRAGESLPPAANKLLKDMGILEEFTQQGHLPCYGNQSRWGSDYLRETDFLRDPMGHGWHLDHKQFEVWLRNKAVERGATFLVPVLLSRVERDENRRRWKVTIMQGDDCMVVYARVLVDTGGRTPVMAKRLGATRIQLDNLVCGWLIGENRNNNDQQGLTYIQSMPQGWWYTAPTPDEKRIIAFHSQAGSPATRWMHSAQSILENAQKKPSLARADWFCRFKSKLA